MYRLGCKFNFINRPIFYLIKVFLYLIKVAIKTYKEIFYKQIRFISPNQKDINLNYNCQIKMKSVFHLNIDLNKRNQLCNKQIIIWKLIKFGSNPQSQTSKNIF
ncbi:unnamed protein product [Paramecium primaurelia]|uniref:Uncharacterized protein n=1 Tax=Paramecium primaurelia TaxID=5886 RepID=A0A8S1LTX3_PARPR|nr:unnamed protein product [Paramecium primaurelia]CAD8070625.1 unnamed protein product [Paramecium primaurelia]